MRILDRYILKSVLGLFFCCVFLFLFLFIIIDVLSHLDDILRQQSGVMFLLQYYLSYLPMILAQVAPFACLLSTLYTFGKLNHNNEIIAMRSSGLSIIQISKTVIIFAFLVSLFVFWLNDTVVPQSMVITQEMKKELEQYSPEKQKEKESKARVIDNLSMYGIGNRLFFINRFSTADNTMEGITILEQDREQNLVKKIVANSGVYEDGHWKFYQSITYDFNRSGQIIQEPRYLEEEITDIPETPQEFIKQMRQPEFMSIKQLRDYINKLSQSDTSNVVRKLKTDLYQRFFSPWTSVFIVLLGIPFSLILRRRSTGLSSIGISIIAGFLYYMLDAVCLALGKGGILIPILAASSAHIIILSLSIYLIKNLP